jgi:hypothetical protein
MRDDSPLKPSRWIAAAVVPLAFLGTGTAVTALWPRLAIVEVDLGVIIGPALTFVYLYRFHGSSIHWLWPLMILMPGLAIDGALAIPAARDGHIHHGAALAGAIVGAVGFVLLALTIIGAVMSGARWVHGYTGTAKQQRELMISGRARWARGGMRRARWARGGMRRARWARGGMLSRRSAR